MTEEMLPPERTSRKITSSGQIKSRGGQKTGANRSEWWHSSLGEKFQLDLLLLLVARNNASTYIPSCCGSRKVQSYIAIQIKARPDRYQIISVKKYVDHRERNMKKSLWLVAKCRILSGLWFTCDSDQGQLLCQSNQYFHYSSPLALRSTQIK